MQANYLDDFFRQSFEVWRDMKLSYERKLFTVAMSNFLFNSEIPAELKPKCGFIMKDIVSCLMRQQRIEQMMAKNTKKVNPIIDNILGLDGYKSSEEEGEEEKKSSCVQQIL